MFLKYVDKYRGYLMDNHLPAPPLFNFDKFNAENHMPLLKKAHVDSFMLQAKSVWGYTYYPTKVGTINPGLKCDYFGEMLEACQKEDIEVEVIQGLKQGDSDDILGAGQKKGTGDLKIKSTFV